MEGTEMKRTTIIAAAAALAISSLCSYAQDKNSAHQFIRIPRDPATGAMAGAGAASTFTTSYSAFRNSAVIPFSDKTVDVGVSYQMWAPDGVKSNDVAAGVAYKVSDKFGFSVGFAYDLGAEMQTYDASGKSSGKFSPSDMVLNAGLGFAFTEKIGAGVNVRYSSDKIADGVTSNGFGADVFVLYKALPELNLTAGVSSLGSSVKDASGQTFSLPMSATIAGAYTAAIDEQNRVDVALDADYFFTGGLGAALGLQYSYDDLVFVRAGYHLGTDKAPLPSFATIGAGVKYSGFKLDVSYLTANPVIGNTLTIGVGVAF